MRGDLRVTHSTVLELSKSETHFLTIQTKYYIASLQDVLQKKYSKLWWSIYQGYTDLPAEHLYQMMLIFTVLCGGRKVKLFWELFCYILKYIFI